ncbi:hypothetical protein [Nocardia farcinica]|uniref:hypothetical protein n=1 Tax=Nocardia farcinica TaxID=37329 RepID=UPI002453F976|nr:hypothetical protein [Nocardia farcinica]
MTVTTGDQPVTTGDQPVTTSEQPVTTSERAVTTSERAAAAISGLRKGFGGRTVLDGIDLDIAEGEIVALVGRPGAGHWAQLRIIGGREAADRG